VADAEVIVIQTRIPGTLGTTSPHADKLTQPSALSSWKMPPKMMPSSMPASWKPFLVMSPAASVGFLSTPKWNCPWPLTSLSRGWVTAFSAALPAEKKTWVVLALVSREPGSGKEDVGLQGVEVQGHGKVVEDARLEGCAEEQLRVVDVAEQLQGVGVGRGAVQERARLEDQLVGAEVVAFEKHELVLVRQVERPPRVLQKAEVESLNTGSGRIGAGVARRDEFCTPEAGLDVIRAWCEDGVVAGMDTVTGGVSRTGR